MVAVRRLDEIEPVNGDRARCELDRLAVAGEVVGAFAFDLYGREPRRHLRDRAREARQHPADRLRIRPRCARLDHLAFRVVGVALLAPAHRKTVAFAPVHHERHGLGRFAERDRQAA